MSHWEHLGRGGSPRTACALRFSVKTRCYCVLVGTQQPRHPVSPLAGERGLLFLAYIVAIRSPMPFLRDVSGAWYLSEPKSPWGPVI